MTQLDYALSPGLADLVTRFRETWGRLMEVDDNRDKCQSAVEESFPPKPKILTTSRIRTDPNPTVHEVPHAWTREEIERLPEWWPRKGERLAAWNAWEAECGAITNASPLAKLEQESEALDEEHHRLVDEIAAYQALSIADVAIKLTIADEWEDFTDDAAEPGTRLMGCRMIAGALRDAERLAGTGGTA